MTMHDSHCHFLSSRFFETLGREKYGPEAAMSAGQVAEELGWEAPGDALALANRWVSELDRAHVSRAAIIGSVPGDEDSVASAVAAHPDRFVGFFAANPCAPGGLERVERAYGTLGLRCACLFPAIHHYSLDDEHVAAVFDLASTHGGAVFVHCGYFSLEARARLGLSPRLDLRCGDPLGVAAVGVRFPKVPVIIPHFGSGLFTEALMAAEACRTIHFDTSSSNAWIRFVPGLSLTDVFRQALQVVGADRLMFGTDSSSFPRGWRRVICGAQRAVLDELAIDDAAREAIFKGTFERIFGI